MRKIVRWFAALSALALLFACAAATAESAPQAEAAAPAQHQEAASYEPSAPSEAQTPADSPDSTGTAPDAASWEAAEKGLEVYFFDIGRVDAILIRCDGETCFIDTGFKEDAKPVLAYLKGLGVEKLTCYIGTHAHADHIAGAAAVIDALRPDRVYIPHRRVRSAIRSYGNHSQRNTLDNIKFTRLDHGDTFQLGGATVKCLGPIRVVNCKRSSQRENENSLIFKLTYGVRTFLFTGDTTDAVLRSVNRKYPGELKADVFKNPHHNGNHDDDVIAMVQPRITVFCTDNANQPESSYRRALKKLGSDVYITGSWRDGNVLITSDGVSLDAYCGYPLTTLRLNPPSGTLAPSEKQRLTGTLKPAGKADPENWLRWTSSDTHVVKVSGGMLTAVSEGTATVTATSINGLTDAVEVMVAADGVSLDHSSLSLQLGETRQLRARPTSDAAKALDGEWLSEDESVAVVTQSGEVIAAGAGETRVVARLSNGAQAVCRVVVAEPAATSVTLSQHQLSLSVGEQASLSAALSPAGATARQLEWASSDESVATVDDSGSVTAAGPGVAKIGVRAASGVYDICDVTVE